VDAEWEKMGRIVAFHEKQFNNKIVPQNKLTPEKVQDFRRQIQRLKTHLVMRRRTESSVLMIQQKLNKLFLDLIEAGSICGMGQIIVPSSMLMTE
jgi:cobalamin biosynthesis Co2+ chelatase CbiK